uniref:Putative homing endonuclease n=1 Tax=viral metagenome TaxID=1070528 RepID=A0A6M3JBT5_9ZZZZ
MEWLAGFNYSGYGAFSVGYTSLRAHRVAFEISNDRSIRDGMNILHRCNNRKCCRPDHLYEGTQSDNNRDRERINPGTGGTPSKFTKQEILRIKEVYKTGTTQRKIARIYNVQPGYISKLINGKRGSNAL